MRLATWTPASFRTPDKAIYLALDLMPVAGPLLHANFITPIIPGRLCTFAVMIIVFFLLHDCSLENEADRIYLNVLFAWLPYGIQISFYIVQ